MAGTLDFDASHRRSVLHALAVRGEPLRLQVTLHGPVTALADRAILCVANGRVHVAKTADRSGVEAMMRILLADRGSVEVVPDAPPSNLADAPTFDALYAEAERRVAQLLEPIDLIGGLGAVLRADLDRLVANVRQIPDAANRIMRLADGRRTVAQIVAQSPFDEVLTTRIIGKLYRLSILVPLGGPRMDPSAAMPVAVGPTAWMMPDRGWGETAELPGEDDLEVEGPEVTGDIAHWLTDETAPPPLMSDDAFARAFVSDDLAMAPEDPTLEGTPPVEPVPAEAFADPASDTDDDADFAAAGVGNRSTSLVVVGLLVLIAGAGGVFALTGGQEARRPAPVSVDAGALLAMTSTRTQTSTVPEPVLTDEPEPDLIGPAPDALRRTIAAANAPSEVREAEDLWESGQFADAARLLRKLRRTRRRDSTVFILSGQVYVDTGKLAQANDMANRALKLNRRSFRAWVLKGSVYQFMGRDRQALAAYRRALKLGPDHEMSDEIRSVVTQLEASSGE